MSTTIELFWMRVKKNKIKVILPLIFLLVILPVFIHVINNSGLQPEEIAEKVRTQLHTWIMVLAGWWSACVFGDFFDQSGNELIYLVNKKKDIIINHVLAAVIYSVVVSLLFVVYSHMTELDYGTLVNLLAEGVFIDGVAIMLSFALQGIGPALMISVAYSFLTNVLDTMGQFKIISVSPRTAYDYKLAAIVTAIGIILSAIGVKLSQD
ncbi:MAG: hypothetical protein K6G63_10955, partial [Eubacterium sp.]|nr:hypothetical protein [Eubacterium sp.]